MVNFQERLDRTFKALADPTRRTILAQLERRDSASISVLADRACRACFTSGRRVMAAIEHVVFYVSQSENTREDIDSRSPSPCARQPDPTL
jgi:DNA-binding transcriptional ArsR family regulator